MPKKTQSKNFLKRECSTRFIKLFRRIVYEPKLTYGEKIFCLVLLDTVKPKRTGAKNLYQPNRGALASISRKLDGPSPGLLSKWKKRINSVCALWDSVYYLLE